MSFSVSGAEEDAECVLRSIAVDEEDEANEWSNAIETEISGCMVLTGIMVGGSIKEAVEGNEGASLDPLGAGVEDDCRGALLDGRALDLTTGLNIGPPFSECRDLISVLFKINIFYYSRTRVVMIMKGKWEVLSVLIWF